jgi:hypothetical protein
MVVLSGPQLYGSAFIAHEICRFNVAHGAVLLQHMEKLLAAEGHASFLSLKGTGLLFQLKEVL